MSACQSYPGRISGSCIFVYPDAMEAVEGSVSLLRDRCHVVAFANLP